MSEKNNQLRILDEACENCMEENGTIKTHGLDVDLWLKNQIKKLYLLGVPRKEIEAVLNKYN